MKQKRPARGLRAFWKRYRKSKVAVVGLVILFIFVVMAVFAPVIAPYTYDEMDLSKAFQSSGAEHFFGTDSFGRDIFSRIIYGARISLTIGFISVGIAVLIGGLIGATAGYYGGWVDNVLMRLMDILMSIPQFLLAISIAAAMGPGIRNLMIAVGISSTPNYARIIRASILSAKEQEYVEAARVSGAGDIRIILRHILPNCLAPLIVQMTLGVAGAILNAAGLSFIGLGAETPIPEWGAMLSEGRDYFRTYPMVALYPGLFISLTIFSLNVVGDGLRDALDPKQRR
ncbi:MAG: ABC transporter permease [Ndongobacter sp.]|nr:ABC transporter permease [Ndongobacter sp.]